MKRRKHYNRPLKNRRVLGFALDLLAIGIFTKSFTLIYAIIINSIFILLDSSTQRIIVETVEHIHASIFILFFLGYFFTSYRFGKGQTLGKMFMQTTVLPEKNSTISSSSALLRSIGYLIYYGVGTYALILPQVYSIVSAYVICYSFAIFWFTLPLVKKNGKGIPDIISGTYVTITETVSLPEIIYLPIKSDEDRAA